MAAGEGCRAGACVWDWGSHGALSFASQKAPKYSLNLETACGASTILGQAVKVWAAAQGCVDAGRAVGGCCGVTVSTLTLFFSRVRGVEGLSNHRLSILHLFSRSHKGKSLQE